MRFGFLILLALGLAGCGLTDPFAPYRTGRSGSLESAPVVVTVQGKAIVLFPWLWRDFMPICPPGGRPLSGVLRVATADSTPLPAGLKADRAWVLLPPLAWETPVVERQPRPPDASSFEVSFDGGPKWGPGIEVDVVVRLLDAQGRPALLRAPAQLIFRTD